MSGRVTAKRVALVRDQLSSSDWKLIGHLATTKLASGRQLRSLINAHTSTETRRLRADLQRLTELRVTARLNRRVGGVRSGSDSFVYALDVLGQRITDPTPKREWRRPWTPTVRILDHGLAATDLYVSIVDADRSGELELLRFATEPACWRTFTGSGGGRLVLKPDAHIIVATDESERHAWIEVDRATESLGWITEKAKVYGRYFDSGREQERHGVFPRTLWIAPDAHRAEQLAGALGHLRAEEWQLHHVATTSTALQALIGREVHP
jgi:hypothetical protein